MWGVSVWKVRVEWECGECREGEGVEVKCVEREGEGLEAE